MKEIKPKEKDLPYVLLNCAMSIDGKIATRFGDTEFSDEEDWRIVHKIRSECDAIMVGKNTIILDNPKLHIKFHQPKKLVRIIVDSTFSIPLDSKVLNYKLETYPTIICVTDNALKSKIERAKLKNIQFINTGPGKQVNLTRLMEELYQHGIEKILLEGGGTLNWSMLKDELVDELRIFISPVIVGGKDAVSLVDGVGVDRVIDGFKFNLQNVLKRSDYVILHYLKA